MKKQPVFVYHSTCCREIAQKEPCVATPEKDGSLGTWQCPKCRKKCSVTRAKNSVD